MSIHQRGKRIISGLLSLALSTSLGTNISHAQTVKTFIALYAEYHSQPQDEIERYSLFVNGPTRKEDLQKILEHQPGLIVVRYQNMIDQDTIATPVGKDIMRNHKDFLLKTIAGQRDSSVATSKKFAWGYLSPYSSKYGNRFMLDPSSIGWRKYYAEMAKKMLSGYPDVGRKGIFFDNAWPFYTLFFHNSPKDLQVDMNHDGVMNEKDDWAWADAIIGFSEAVREILGPSSVLIANFGTRWSYGGTGAHILSDGAFDGAVNEEFAHNTQQTDTSYYPPLKVWKQDVNALMIADSLGKIALAQSYGLETDAGARIFSIATFLLGEGRKSYYNYRFRAGYDVYYRLPEFDLDIGRPLQWFRDVDQTLDASDGLYRRTFEKGQVVVNPGGRSVTVQLKPGERLMSLQGGTVANAGKLIWTDIASITLIPHSAAIVLSATQ